MYQLQSVKDYGPIPENVDSHQQLRLYSFRLIRLHLEFHVHE